jgi:uncharacterized phage-associated protein
MNLSIHAVADYLLAYMRERGDLVTHLKLQKLVYYAQAWFLAMHNEELFADDCEAWVHGPVYPALYNRFRDYAWKPILDAPDEQTFATEIALPFNVKEHLHEIVDVFGGESANTLERMTHREMPWIKARKGLPEDASSTEIILKSDMHVFYQHLAEQAELA